jgi:hypothetical protein
VRKSIYIYEKNVSINIVALCLKNISSRADLLIDVKKLSKDASMHAPQNECLPFRVVVQGFFFKQVRAAASVPSLGQLAKKNSKNSRSGMQFLSSQSRRIFDKLWVVDKGHEDNQSSETSESSRSPDFIGSWRHQILSFNF